MWLPGDCMSYETASSSCLLLFTHLFPAAVFTSSEKIQNFMFDSYSFSFPSRGYLQKFSGLFWLIFFFNMILLGAWKRRVFFLDHHLRRLWGNMVLCVVAVGFFSFFEFVFVWSVAFTLLDIERNKVYAPTSLHCIYLDRCILM